MSFELKNAEATFQRMVNKVFKELIRHTMEVYIDDMLVKSLRCINNPFRLYCFSSAQAMIWF